MNLLERDREVEAIEQLLQAARGGRGHMLFIEGPPGIGKTELAQVVVAHAREAGMRAYHARASELDRYFPYGVVRQLFVPLLGDAPEQRAGWLRGPASTAVPLLTGRTSDVGSNDPLAHFHALYWLIANVTEDAPLVIVIDDLHWADPSSVRFLQFLLPRLAELPVLVTVAARPPETQNDRTALDAIATDSLTSVLRPSALSALAVRELVEEELGEGAADGFSAACRAATGGNPFLLRELLRELAAERVLPADEHTALVRQVAPPTVARAVLLRLARLGPDAMALARAVAVLGDGVSLQRAATLAELGLHAAHDAADRLTGAAVLSSARPLSFAHPILRAAVYSDMEEGERAREHRRAAELLAREGAGAVESAVHLLETEPAGDVAVPATLRAAAQDARARGSPSSAVAYLRRASAEPPPAGQRAAILAELGSAEVHAGQHAAAVQHFEEALAGEADPRLRAAHVRDWSIALQALDRHEEAFTARERAIREIQEMDGEAALSLEGAVIASGGLHQSRLEWARRRLEHHRRLPATTPASARIVALRAYFDSFYGSGSADELARAAEQALASGGLIERGDDVPTTPFFAAVEVLCLADRNGLAREALDEALDVARRRGSELIFACVSGWRCHLLARTGALREAEADARSCAELALRQGGFTFAPPMLGYVLNALIDRGDVEAAERILVESGMAKRADAEDLSLYPMFHARARLRALARDAESALSDFETLARRRARWNTDLTLVPPVLAAPTLQRAAPEPAPMLDDAHEWGTPRALGLAFHAAGRLEEAAETLEQSPGRTELAHALLDLGAQLRRSNQRVAARDPLRRALDLAEEAGASLLATRAGQELRAAGGRPRRPRISGAEALTPSERRVAEMAADGLSNPEIAQALFVTRKTVEAHLASSYRKLDIRSRAELPSALEAGEE